MNQSDKAGQHKGICGHSRAGQRLVISSANSGFFGWFGYWFYFKETAP